MPFRHDAGVFRPNGVSRRNFDGMKTPNPRCFGVWVVIGKKVEAKNPNGVSAKCAIRARRGNAVFWAGLQAPEVHQAPISVTTGGFSLPQLPPKKM